MRGDSMKKIKFLGGMSAAFLAAVTLASCGPQPSAKTYHVKFTNGNEFVDEKDYKENEEIKAPADPTPETGYTFDGWYEGEFKFVTGLKATKDYNFEAKFSKESEFTVTFKEGGTVVDTKKITASSKKITAPTAEEHDHYENFRWHCEADNIDIDSEGEYEFAELKDYTFEWDADPIEYTISFYEDNPTPGNAEPLFTETLTIEDDKITAPDPEEAEITKTKETWEDWIWVNAEESTDIWEVEDEREFSEDELNDYDFYLDKRPHEYRISFQYEGDEVDYAIVSSKDEDSHKFTVPTYIVDHYDTDWYNEETQQTLTSGQEITLSNEQLGDYVFTNKKGDAHNYTATLKDSNKQLEDIEVNYDIENWEEDGDTHGSRKYIANCLPEADDTNSYLLDKLIGKTFPSEEPTYTYTKYATFFDYNISTAEELHQNLKFNPRSSGTFKLEDSVIKASDISGDLIYTASSVTDFELEFTVKSSNDDRITVVFGLDNLDDLDKGYAGGQAAGKAAIVIAPNNDSPLRFRLNNQDTKNVALNECRETWTKKPMANGVKVKIQVLNGAVKVYYDDKFIYDYDISEYYSGGHIGIARGNVDKANYEFVDNFNLKAFDGSFDYNFEDGVTHSALLPKGRCDVGGGAKSTVSIEDDVPSGSKSLKLVSGNGNDENFYTPLKYKDFTVEFSMEKSSDSADGGRFGFFVANKFSDLQNNQSIDQNAPTNGFRLTIRPSGDSSNYQVRYRLSGQQGDTKATAGTQLLALNANFIQVKIVVSNNVVTVFMKDNVTISEYEQYASINLPTEGDNEYLGGYIGFSSQKTSYLDNIKLTIPAE